MAPPPCRECFSGAVHSHVEPKGRDETVHGLPTYIATPDPGVEPLGIVVILTDAFGWSTPNVRGVADAYARLVPCTVYVPDVMAGNAAGERAMARFDYTPLPTDGLVKRLFRRTTSYLQLLPTMLRFLYRNRKAVARPRLLAYLRAIRTAHPTTKIGVAGFCWGGLHAILLTHDIPDHHVAVDSNTKLPLIDCAFSAHPGMLKVTRDVDAVTFPLSVANGDDDEFMGTRDMEQLVKILAAKNSKLGGLPKYETVVYPGAKHGFAVRAKLDDEVQGLAFERSREQAVAWFRRWFETTT